MSVRKLNKEEIRSLYNTLAGHFSPPTELQVAVQKMVKKYYPDTAVSAVVTVHSEYNDQGYDNHASYVGIYDATGKELLPIDNEAAKAARGGWHDLPVPSESDEQLGDISLFLSTQPLPALYVED